MKVFISWSGDRSRKIAEAIRDWLPAVIQAVKPYYSPDDIAKGARWSNEIAKELEAATLGILCLTPENLDAPWIIFEAGALSKNLDTSRVCPILFGVEPTDIKGPLVQFQASRFDKEEMHRVVKMLNNELGSSALAPEVFEAVFEMWWPRLEERVQQELASSQVEGRDTRRSERDLLEEILTIARSLSRLQISPETSQELIASYREVVEAAVLGNQSDLIDALRRMSIPLRHLPRPRSIFSLFGSTRHRELEEALKILDSRTIPMSSTGGESSPSA